MRLNFDFSNEQLALDNIEMFITKENDWGALETLPMERVYNNGGTLEFDGFICDIPNPMSYNMTIQIDLKPKNPTSYIIGSIPNLNIDGEDYSGYVLEDGLTYQIEVTYNNTTMQQESTKGITIDTNGNTGYRILSFTLIPSIPPTQEQLPYVSEYEMTLEQLDNLKNFIYSQESEDVKERLRSNILGIFMLPFKLENDKEPIPIFIDIYNTEITALPVTTITYEKDLGVISIPDYTYNSSIGMKNVKVQLVTPYFPIIELDSNEVLNTVLSIKYKIDMLGGKATLNVYNDTNNSLISSTQKNISLSIPYIIDNSTKNDEYSNILYNDTNICYVKVMVQVPRNSKSLETIERVQIGSGNQLIRADNPIFTDLNASENEETELIQLLRNGVIL